MFYFIMVKKLVANFYVILSLFESCHIGNLTSFFYFYMLWIYVFHECWEYVGNSGATGWSYESFNSYC